MPVALLALLLGPAHVFTQEALFFSKVAVVTFGGAYAVLAYVAQQAVETYHWLRPDEMLTGLGLAETTPGPLILVLVFVGFLAGARGETGLDPLLAGTIGAIDHALGDVRAVLPLHLRRRALHRAAARQPLRRRRARGGDGGGRRRHRQPRRCGSACTCSSAKSARRASARSSCRCRDLATFDLGRRARSRSPPASR